MIDEYKAAESLDTFIEDVAAGRTPRVVQTMAQVLDIEANILMELLPLFDFVNRIYASDRQVIGAQTLRGTNGNQSKPAYPRSRA